MLFPEALVSLSRRAIESLELAGFFGPFRFYRQDFKTPRKRKTRRHLLRPRSHDPKAQEEDPKSPICRYAVGAVGLRADCLHGRAHRPCVEFSRLYSESLRRSEDTRTFFDHERLPEVPFVTMTCPQLKLPSLRPGDMWISTFSFVPPSPVPVSAIAALRVGTQVIGC